MNRNVVALAWTSFFSDAGHEMATAVLPAFLVSIGGGAASLGAIEGIADGASSAIKLVGGWLADRLGRRKPILVPGYWLTGIASASYALAASWPGVLVARTIGWMARGVRGPTRDALLAGSVPPSAYGRAFGFQRALDTAGAVLGPLAATALLVAVTPRTIFVCSLVPAVIAGCIVLAGVREVRTLRHEALSLRGHAKNIPKSFWVFLTAAGLFGSGDFAHSMLTLYAITALTPSLGHARAAAIGALLYALHNAAQALAAFPAGWLGDRFDRRRVLAAGYLLQIAMCAAFVAAPAAPWALALPFALAGVGLALVDATEGAVAADLLPEQSRATGYGALAAMNGVGDAVSSLLVGALWAGVSVAAGFAFSAAAAGAGILALLALRLPRRVGVDG
jgi:MFS family permease